MQKHSSLHYFLWMESTTVTPVTDYQTTCFARLSSLNSMGRLSGSPSTFVRSHCFGLYMDAWWLKVLVYSLDRCVQEDHRPAWQLHKEIQKQYLVWKTLILDKTYFILLRWQNQPRIPLLQLLHNTIFSAVEIVLHGTFFMQFSYCCDFCFGHLLWQKWCMQSPFAVVLLHWTTVIIQMWAVQAPGVSTPHNQCWLSCLVPPSFQHDKSTCFWKRRLNRGKKCTGMT